MGNEGPECEQSLKVPSKSQGMHISSRISITFPSKFGDWKQSRGRGSSLPTEYDPTILLVATGKHLEYTYYTYWAVIFNRTPTARWYFERLFQAPNFPPQNRQPFLINCVHAWFLIWGVIPRAQHIILEASVRNVDWRGRTLNSCSNVVIPQSHFLALNVPYVCIQNLG